MGQGQAQGPEALKSNSKLPFQRSEVPAVRHIAYPFAGPFTTRKEATLATLTSHYGINGDVPFIDVTLGRDTPLFVDPYRIRLSATPTSFAVDAVQCMDTFFGTIGAAVLSTDPTCRKHAEALLGKFKEPRETHLGYAQNSINGHGGAEDIGAGIWSAMNEDIKALFTLGVLKHLEDLSMYVEDVAEDRTSDITSRIIFGPLADFTAEMIQRYPEFTGNGNVTVDVERQIWDSENWQWASRTITLPCVDGVPLMLVPKEWVGSSILMSSGRFFETTLLGFIQDERTSILTDGSLSFPTKKTLLRQKTPARGRDTNLAVTLRAYDGGIDLLKRHRSWVADRYKDSLLERGEAA